MSKETLHTARYIFPGLILLLILFPLFNENQGILDIRISQDDYIYILVVYAIGGLYYLINPRSRLMEKPLKKVNENIKDKLLDPYVNDPDIMKSIDNLRNNDKLLNIFYHFLDQDDSLKERAKEVYLNGFIWSSLIDILIISPICAIIYYLGFLITRNMHIMFYMIIGIFVLSVIFIPFVFRKQLNLSNNQLAYIVSLYKNELRQHLLS